MPRKTPIAGFISPPRWFDPSPMEFASICADSVLTQQTILPLCSFDFRPLENIARTLPEMLTSARALGEAGCDVIAKTGTPFAWAGLTTEPAMRERCRMLGDAAGVPVVMAGTAIIDGLRALDASRIVVSSPYYTEPWRRAWRQILETCGFEVVALQSLYQQGLVPDGDDVDDHSWTTDPKLVTVAAAQIAEENSQAEAVVITGAGARTLALTDELEKQTGRPVLASDTALYWSTARAIDTPLKDGALGRLTHRPAER